MKLAITIAATSSYCYAMKTLAARVAANLHYAEWREPGIAIIAGDNSKEVKAAVSQWKETLPADWKIIHLVAGQENPSAANYKTEAQMLIARLRTAAFTAARRENSDYCWSLDSDTLPPANALCCMLDMLRFDAGRCYQISTCPYPNESFLGGRGNQYHPIAEDFIESERTLPEALANDLKTVRDEMAAMEKEARTAPGSAPTPEQTAKWNALEERHRELLKKVHECPPTGNIWEVIAKHGWRQRGWLDHAYPAIGKGAVVPTDWCGFGCTLMGKQALAFANFEGYDGNGTEDLFVVWRRWWTAGLKINVITHCPCDHVIWSKKKGGSAEEYTLISSYHETHGETIGHLRTRKQPWKEF